MKNDNPTTYILSSKDTFDRINKICTAAHHLSSVEEILEVSLRNTLELLNAMRGSIFLIDDSGKELTLKTSFGMNTSQQKKLVKQMGEGIVGKVAEQKKPIIVDDIHTDGRFKNYRSSHFYKSPSFICSPLMIKDKFIGVINIAEKESGRSFEHKDLELLDFISNQIAVNYQHANLNQSLRITQEETQKLKRQVVLQERLATIGKLAGGIAHEFNNPLDGVIRYTNLALEHIDDNDAVLKEYLLEVRQGLKRMANIVKSLLACARNTQPTLAKVDVNRCIEQTLKELQAHLLRKNITVMKSLQKGIPEITDLGVDRILSNLISNAIDAMSDRGKLSIRTIVERGFIKINIEDNGKGIPKEHLDRIFEPFFTTKKIEHGCGLGLTIVGEIIKHYQGEIEVESIPENGTMFTVLLPIERNYESA